MGQPEATVEVGGKEIPQVRVWHLRSPRELLELFMWMKTNSTNVSLSD